MTQHTGSVFLSSGLYCCQGRISKSLQFPVRTDHDALRMMVNMTDAAMKLVRWPLGLSGLDFVDFEVVHPAGIKHQAAEALSRFPTAGADELQLEDVLPVLKISNSQLESKSTKSNAKILYFSVWSALESLFWHNKAYTSQGFTGGKRNRQRTAARDKQVRH